MNNLVIDLTISADEFQRLYTGTVRDVVAMAQNGQRVRFPAKILIPFVSLSGIKGRFQIQFDAQHRFQSIRRLD